MLLFITFLFIAMFQLIMLLVVLVVFDAVLGRRSAAIRDLVAWSWASWLVRMLGGGPRRETA
jgi:hypothetical protein